MGPYLRSIVDPSGDRSGGAKDVVAAARCTSGFALSRREPGGSQVLAKAITREREGS